MTYSQEPRQLKDFDVLGVGASRRERLLKETGFCALSIHPSLIPKEQRATYEAVLSETLQWLKPQAVHEVKINKSPEDFMFPLLLEDLKKEFPRTAHYLKAELKEVLKSYLNEFPWQGSLLTEQFHYFPVFLKRKFQDSHLYLIAQKEWLWSYLSFADFGFPPREKGRIVANPSLQSLHVTSEIIEVQLTPGVYIYYYDYSQKKVRGAKLDVHDAAVVDILQEDRKYSLDQLLEQVLMLDLVGSLSREVWMKKLSYLRGEGIILESG